MTTINLNGGSPGIVDRRNQEKLYIQIMRLVVDEIGRGTWVIGDRIPSEDELAVRFGVSKITIRQALSTLDHAGVIGNIKFDRKGSNAVVSRKLFLIDEKEKKRRKVFSHLAKNQRLAGVVKSLTNFGAFVDVGGVEGLLHVSDMSWGKIGHPSELFHQGCHPVSGPRPLTVFPETPFIDVNDDDRQKRSFASRRGQEQVVVHFVIQEVAEGRLKNAQRKQKRRK